MAVNLNSPVGTITTQLAGQRMKREPADTREQCVEKAQAMGSCGTADDWCEYYGFEGGKPAQTQYVPFVGPRMIAGTPGTCYMGPIGASEINVESDLSTTGGPGVPLFITPSSQGDTQEDRYLNTVKQMVRRSQNKLDLKIETDQKQSEANQVALKILERALEKGQTFEKAKEEYEKELLEQKVENVRGAHAEEMSRIRAQAEQEKRNIELQKGLLDGKSTVIKKKDEELEETEQQMDEIQQEVLQKGQEILDHNSQYERKDKLVQILILILFVFSIVAFLMFIYYGVKFARD